MSLENTLVPSLRRDAEALMQATCTITRPGGEPTFDPGTGTHNDPAPTTVYTGKCRVRPEAERTTDAGETLVTLQRYTVHIPASETGVQLDDMVEVDASPGDSALVGKVMRVREVPADDWLVERRLVCEEDAG